MICFNWFLKELRTVGLISEEIWFFVAWRSIDEHPLDWILFIILESLVEWEIVSHLVFNLGVYHHLLGQVIGVSARRLLKLIHLRHFGLVWQDQVVCNVWLERCLVVAVQQACVGLNIYFPYRWKWGNVVDRGWINHLRSCVSKPNAWWLVLQCFWILKSDWNMFLFHNLLIRILCSVKAVCCYWLSSSFFERLCLFTILLNIQTRLEILVRRLDKQLLIDISLHA